MSSILRGRLWSLPLIALAVLASLLATAPGAHATTQREGYFWLTYDCLKGQSLTLTPGKAQVKLSDSEGNGLGYADIVKAELGVFPLWMNDEGSRYQLETNPGTETNFHPEEGLLLSDEETVWFTYRLEWSGSGNATVEYQPSHVECTGAPTDTDGDGVHDEIDVCPNTAGGGTSDGCPAGVSLSVISIQGANTVTGAPGSATINVTNIADSDGSEVFRVWYDEQSHDVTLGDGDNSWVTFTGPSGSWNICAKSTTRVASTCITATVPSYTPPQYSGKVVYTQTCTGLRYTITNTGNKPVTASVWLSHLGSRGSTTEWLLAPGASRTATTPRYFNATIRPTLYANGVAWQQALPSKQWVVPSTCWIRMVGGTKLIKWGPRTVRDGMPYAIVYTRAYHALVGYQVRGSSRIHWVSDYDTQGRHRFGNFLRLKRGKQITLRLWVVYVDANHIKTGKKVFTDWRTFRRPRS